MQKAAAAMLGVIALGFGISVKSADSFPPASIPSDPLRFKGPIVMARTPIAPFNAEGSATFLSGFGSTNGPAMLSLDLRGFAPGHYLFGIVTVSDRAFVPLAKFVIIDPTAGPDRDTTLNTKTPSSAEKAESLVSQHVVPLARLDDPFDIAKLVLADAYGNYLLIADFKPARRPGGS